LEVEYMPSFPDRVAAKAADIKVARILLSLIAVPFYVVGIVVGVAWLAIRWTFAAVVVGFSDACGKRSVIDDDAV